MTEKPYRVELRDADAPGGYRVLRRFATRKTANQFANQVPEDTGHEEPGDVRVIRDPMDVPPVVPRI